MANKKGSRQLTWTDRISIEALKKAGHSVIEIAEQLGVHRSTIYNELKRGEYMHRNSDYTETLSYSPNKAQMKAEENLKARGTQLKIGNDIAYANYIEDKIVNEDYSPAAVLGELKAQGKEGDFSVTVCVTTEATEKGGSRREYRQTPERDRYTGRVRQLGNGQRFR